jgi:ATP-dependent protease HslVU (ClpYQ) peptidase subunit
MKNGYSAVGSGASYALGTLYILKEKVNEFSNMIEPPSYIVNLALQAAAHYSTSVSAPFVIRKIYNDK